VRMSIVGPVRASGGGDQSRMNHYFSIIILFIGGVADRGLSPNRGQSPINSFFPFLPAGLSPASHRAAKP
jgi:hypothetical protein